MEIFFQKHTLFTVKQRGTFLMPGKRIRYSTGAKMLPDTIPRQIEARPFC